MSIKLKNIYNKILNIIKAQNKLLQLNAISYKQIIQLMEEKGLYQEFENELNDFEEIEQLMQNNTHLHGINHIVRVLFNAYAIMALENVNEKDKKIVVVATKLHDIGRTEDGEDEEHGYKSAIKARGILESKGFSKEEIDEICFIIKEYSLPKQKNEEDIQNLPEELKEKYRYHLNLVKDADKLDRVRIGDLDPNRLSTNSAKRLIEVAKIIFEYNIYYYKKKMKVYEFDENDAKKILEEVNKQNLEYDITLEDIKNNYSKYKLIQEQNKIELLKLKKDDMSIDDFIEIISTVTNEDLKYMQQKNCIGKGIIIQAIYDMGINQFMALKTEGKLSQIMNLNNYKRLILKMTKTQKDILMKFRRMDYRDSVVSNFYLYWHTIKNYTQEKLDMLLLINSDEYEYIQNRTLDKGEGYKWFNNMLYVPFVFKMVAVTNKKMDKKLMLNIRQKLNIPLNIIITALLELDFLKDEENLAENDLEKILLNYHKFNLNIREHKDIEQVKKLLLSLPDDLSKDYEEIIKECLMGRLKRFNLDNFEQLKDYKKICNEKILQEFQENEDVEYLKKLIIETKIKDLEGVQRDIYFYKKYNKQEAECNEVVCLFDRLLKSQDKQELLNLYQKLNNINEDFDLDSAFDSIRKELSLISKEDIVSAMQKMQEKIRNSETKNINGQDAIDITGTDFNLLISVIGAMGSPYLTNYYNHIVDILSRNRDRKILFPILNMTTDVHIKLGLKRLINKRYKLDPLKNRQRCVSSIDQDFIGHIKSECYTNEKKQKEEKLILAYFPKNKKDISYMGNQDLMSIYDKDRSDITRKRIPHKDNVQGICNLKLQDLNATTIGDDNEIIINSYPGAVMCFDKISNIAKKTAKKLNLPILYIDTKKQFEIMKNRLYDYYAEIREQILENNHMSDEIFENAFNKFDQDNNIIHRAFKIANSFTFLDDDEYPKEQIIEVFNNMSSLVNESIKKCSLEQQKVIREIMLGEADNRNLRYGNYDTFIDFQKLINVVSIEDNTEELHKDNM